MSPADELQAALVEAEQRLARMGELELELREVTTDATRRIDELVLERDALRTELEAARSEVRSLKAARSYKLAQRLRRG